MEIDVNIVFSPTINIVLTSKWGCKQIANIVFSPTIYIDLTSKWRWM